MQLVAEMLEMLFTALILTTFPVNKNLNEPDSGSQPSRSPNQEPIGLVNRLYHRSSIMWHARLIQNVLVLLTITCNFNYAC